MTWETEWIVTWDKSGEEWMDAGDGGVDGS